jgi:hypothetical protein
MVILHEDQYTFLITYRSLILRIKSISDKIFRGYQNTFCVQSFFFLKNRATYEITWKNIVEWGRPPMTI